MRVKGSGKKVSLAIFGLIFLFFIGPALSGCAPRKGQIVVWHWMQDRQDAFLGLSKKYYEETGVKVKFVLCSPTVKYNKKVNFAAKTGSLPDIYGMLGDIWEFAGFTKGGNIADISAELNADGGAWRNQLITCAISENEFLPGNRQDVKPGIYGLPIEVTNIQMIYNKDLFRAAGLNPESPPQTWDEFIEYGKKLKRAGIPVFVSGWSELWMVNCFANIYALNLMGEEKVNQTIRSQVSYTDSEWLRIMRLFEEMADAGMLADNILSIDNKRAEEIFANSQAAIAFNGSWCINVYKKLNPDLNYGVFMPPRLSYKYPMRVWGGGAAPFVVNAKSKNKKEAIEFLKWLTSNEQQKFLARSVNLLPVNRETVLFVPFKLRGFADSMINIIDPKTQPVSEHHVINIELAKGIHSVIRKERTPTQVGTHIDLIKRVLDVYKSP